MRNLYGRLALDDGQAAHTRALGKLSELQLGGRTLGIQAGEQDAATFLRTQHEADLAGGRGLAGALKSDHQDGNGGRDVEVERDGAFATQALDQNVVDDLDDLLAGRDGAGHFGANGAVADLGDEFLHHRQGDVGLQQSQTRSKVVERRLERLSNILASKTISRRCANTRGATDQRRRLLRRRAA